MLQHEDMFKFTKILAIDFELKIQSALFLQKENLIAIEFSPIMCAVTERHLVLKGKEKKITICAEISNCHMI